MKKNPIAQDNAARSTAVAPRFRLAPTDKATIDGIDHAPKSGDENGHVLRRLDNDMCELFTHEQLDAIRKEGDTRRHWREFCLASKAQLRSTQPEALLADLPPTQRAKVRFRKQFCDEFLRMEAGGLATRSDASMKVAVRTILSSGHLFNLENRRRRSGGGVQFPPSTRSLRRWLADYSASG